MKANLVTDKKEHLEDMLLAVEEPILDIDNILDSLSGDEAAVRFLLELFIHDHSGDGEKFRQLMNNDDRERAQRLVHSLRGVSGNLGAMVLYSVSSDIEHLMKQDIEVPKALIAKLSNELKRTVDFAQQVLNLEKMR
ncbi:hypothetical protein AK966_04750 [Vibrio sp. PID23_8]|nr:hypothetical protein AK966_04750 [Vibrio sp. PID23_8]